MRRPILVIIALLTCAIAIEACSPTRRIAAPAGAPNAFDASQLKNKMQAPYQIAGLENSNASALAVGRWHACALTGDSVRCWGDNSFGQLGDGSTEARKNAVPVRGLEKGVREIAAGDQFTCALLTDGRVFCWGDNSLGAAGPDGKDICIVATAEGKERQVPCALSPAAIPALSEVKELSAAGEHACVLTAQGAYCWGDNRFEQLGPGTGGLLDHLATPRRVTDLPSHDRSLSRLSAGDIGTCAVAAGGAITCWGAGSPAVLEEPVTAVSVGGGYSCALANVGTVRCWGANDLGQLGSGERRLVGGPTAAESEEPNMVEGIERASAVSVGTDHACAIQDGTAWCWGANFGYALGRESTENCGDVEIAGEKARVPCSTRPMQVWTFEGAALTGVSAIDAGPGSTCAVSNSTVWCWGLDFWQQRAR